MTNTLTIITVVEGGNLQQVNCPDPSIIINHVSIDYDLAETGDLTDLEDLVHALASAYSTELAFAKKPTVLDALNQYGMQLEQVRKEVELS